MAADDNNGGLGLPWSSDEGDAIAGTDPQTVHSSFEQRFDNVDDTILTRPLDRTRRPLSTADLP